MRRRRMSLAFLSALLVQLLLLPAARSQQLIPDNLPACAKTCSLLQEAQGSCETNPSSAQSCFCQSALLTPIKSSTSNVCAPACADADFQKIASWYKSTCANGGTNAAAGGSSGGNSGNSGNTNGDNTQSTATASPSATAAAGGSGINQDQTGEEWWGTHWQWIVMVLVLVIGFTAIGVGGRIWYRRRHKKVDGEIVEATPETRPPDMGMWAPSRHSVHDFTNAHQQATRPVSTVAPLPQRQRTLTKGKQREGQPARPPLGRSPSQRLKAAMEHVQM